MKKFILFFLLLIAAGCTQVEEPFIKSLGAMEFSNIIEDSQAFVVDVHVPEQEHIKGTNAFISYDVLDQNLDHLPEDKNAPIAVYCRGGSMSKEAAQTLQRLGYTKIYDLDGGTNAWRDAGLEFSSELESYNSIKREMTVFKSASCGCCVQWAPYIQREGFDVETVSTDMASIKQQYGIPRNMESCHTAIIGDYFVEGHVPIEAIEKLLAEQPDIDGIALPAMPAGSPGMPGVKQGPFTIYAVKDGEVSTFMTI